MLVHISAYINCYINVVVVVAYRKGVFVHNIVYCGYNDAVGVYVDMNKISGLLTYVL